MSERRFTEKPDLNPEAVRSLPDGHPALVENRTLFPSTVVTVTADAPDRLLVSGENNTDPVTRMTFAVEHQRRMSTPEARARQSRIITERWNDPVAREKLLKGMQGAKRK